MELEEIIVEEQWLNTLNAAIEKRRYDYLGKIISQMNNYIEGAIKELEEAKHSSSLRESLASKFVLRDLSEKARNLKLILQDVKIIYAEARHMDKNIEENDPLGYKMGAHDAIAHYFGQMLHNLGLVALRDFGEVIKSTKSYKSMLEPPKY